MYKHTIKCHIAARSGQQSKQSMFNMYMYSMYNMQLIIKSSGPRAPWSPEHQRLHTDLSAEGPTLPHKLPNHRINDNQQWHRKAAPYSLNMIAKMMHTDRAEDNAYSL